MCGDMMEVLWTCRGSFRCLADYVDNFSENPSEVPVVFSFNGPELCHRGKFGSFFFKYIYKRLSCVATGMLPTCSGFFFILDGVMQVLHGGRLTVNHLFSVFSEWEEAGEN